MNITNITRKARQRNPNSTYLIIIANNCSSFYIKKTDKLVGLQIPFIIVIYTPTTQAIRFFE